MIKQLQKGSNRKNDFKVEKFGKNEPCVFFHSGGTTGTLKHVGTDTSLIYEETKKLLVDKNAYEKMSKASNPYGDGNASKRIVDAIIEKFN